MSNLVVLVVEDNPVDQAILRINLGNVSGIEVLFVDTLERANVAVDEKGSLIAAALVDGCVPVRDGESCAKTLTTLGLVQKMRRQMPKAFLVSIATLQTHRQEHLSGGCDAECEKLQCQKVLAHHFGLTITQRSGPAVTPTKDAPKSPLCVFL